MTVFKNVTLPDHGFAVHTKIILKGYHTLSLGPKGYNPNDMPSKIIVVWTTLPLTKGLPSQSNSFHKFSVQSTKSRLTLKETN